MPFTTGCSYSTFHIPFLTKHRYKVIIITSSIIVAASILLGYLLSVIYTAAFHKKLDNHIKLAENEILVFFNSASEMLNMLTLHPYVRAADGSIHTYMSEGHKGKPFAVSKSRTEENIRLLFESIDAGFSDYLEIFMGTKWGGFVTSFKGDVSAGYDPRKRIWYQYGSDAQGRTALTKAFYTHNLATSVIVLAKSVYDMQDTFTGNVAISFSLSTLTAKIAKFSMGSGGAIVLLQEDGTILADPIHPQHIFTHIIATDIPHPQQFMQVTNQLRPVIINNKNMLFQVHAISKLPWKLIAFVEEKELWNACSLMLRYMIITGILITAVLIFLPFLHMIRMLNPVKHVLMLLRLVSHHTYHQYTMPSGKDDIERIPEHCAILLNEIREEMAVAVRQKGDSRL